MPYLIITSKGKDYKCLYDSRDQKKISRFTWSLHSKGYACAYKEGKQILMHRLILGLLDKPKIEVDHRFHNRLDNRRAKIRVCSHSQNRQNSRKVKPGSCVLKGVYRDQNKWHAQIMIGDRVTNLGRYRSQITAGRIYDQTALETFKDFAFLNFPDSDPLPQQLTITI
jgi:histidinol phosphatase-like enzyme